MEDSAKFEELVKLIKTVKPTLQGVDITPDDYLTESLGLDSLDVAQLLRAVRRKLNRDFDSESWLADSKNHKLSVLSLHETISTATGS